MHETQISVNFAEHVGSPCCSHQNSAAILGTWNAEPCSLDKAARSFDAKKCVRCCPSDRSWDLSGAQRPFSQSPSVRKWSCCRTFPGRRPADSMHHMSLQMACPRGHNPPDCWTSRRPPNNIAHITQTGSRTRWAGHCTCLHLRCLVGFFG